MLPPSGARAEAGPGTAAGSGTAHSAAVLGMIGAGELAAFSRLAADAEHAPDLSGRVTISRMAAGELAHLDAVERRARALGVDLLAAAEPFQGVLADFDRRTSPSDWWERLVRTYVGFGVVLDFQRELAAGLGDAAGPVREEVLADNGHGDYVVGVLGPVIAAEPQLGARLALWGRRVVGEALATVQHLLARDDRLAGSGDEPLAGRGKERSTALLSRLAAEHARRMARLGLTA